MKQSQLNLVLKAGWIKCDLETQHEYCMFSVKGTEISKIQFTLNKVGRHGHRTRIPLTTVEKWKTNGA